MTDPALSDSALPDPKPSVAIGAVAFAVLSVGLAFLAAGSGGTALQYAVGCLGCLIILAGPMVAVWHYTSTYDLTILAGRGAAMGAAAGALGALASGAISQLLVMAGLLPTPAETIEASRRQMIDGGMDPEQAGQFAEQFGGMASNPLMATLINVAIAAALGALFGALAASVFKKGGDGPAPVVRAKA